MADNYLENKMEEYRRRQAAPKSRRQPARQPLEGKCAVVAGDAAAELTAAIVATLCGRGCKVDILDAPGGAGQRLAQHTGARYVPAIAGDPASLSAAMELIGASRPGLDLLVAVEPAPGAGEGYGMIGMILGHIDALAHVAAPYRPAAMACVIPAADSMEAAAERGAVDAILPGIARIAGCGVAGIAAASARTAAEIAAYCAAFHSARIGMTDC